MAGTKKGDIYPIESFKQQRKRHTNFFSGESGKPMDKGELIITTTIVMVILLFMYTGVSKLLEYDKFVFQMRRAPHSFTQAWAPFLGRAVPLAELLLVLFLFLDKTRFWALIGSLILMVFFEVYIIWMKIIEVQTGIKLPCTCGGIISNMGWTAHLLFNAVFIFFLGLSVYYKWKTSKSKIT